jgi:hypothetical protein
MRTETDPRGKLPSMPAALQGELVAVHSGIASRPCNFATRVLSHGTTVDVGQKRGSLRRIQHGRSPSSSGHNHDSVKGRQRQEHSHAHAEGLTESPVPLLPALLEELYGTVGELPVARVCARDSAGSRREAESCEIEKIPHSEHKS